ncbi:GGDEF domain-containing protein [Deinococcus aquiradiocola]|nr:GGDEF domain-containing protein [Deinococcus aquiradiocola]
MNVTVADAQQAWDLRFSAPAAVHAWLRSVPHADATSVQVLAVEAFLEWRRGQIRQALSMVRQAEEALSGDGQTVWHGRLLNLHAVLLYISGDIARCVTLLQEQLSLGQRLQDAELQALALNDLGAIMAWNSASSAYDYYRQAADLVTDGSPAMTAIRGLITANMAGVHHHQGEFALAAPLVDLAEALILDAHAMMLWPWCVNLQIAQATHAGRYGQARQLLNAALARLDERSEFMGEALHMLWLTAARLELQLGDPGQAMIWLGRLQDEDALRGDARLHLLDLTASIHAGLGDHAQAYRSMRTLLETLLKQYQHERVTLVSRLELHRVTEAAQLQAQEARQVTSALMVRLDEVQSIKGHYERLSVTDALTGLSNRRQFDRDLPFLADDDGLLMIDIDHFKRINDTFGHQTGDEVLRDVAVAIRGALRPGDRAYRYGGEEFAVILKGAGHTQLSTVAERLRLAVALGRHDPAGAVTVSVGGVLVDAVTGADAVRHADTALYAAKQAGRNRTRLTPAEPGSAVREAGRSAGDRNGE